jgi:hypothetical protein
VKAVAFISKGLEKLAKLGDKYYNKNSRIYSGPFYVGNRKDLLIAAGILFLC